MPLRFRNVHTDLLLDLDVDRTPSVFNKIVEDIEALIGRPKPESAPTKAEAKQKTEVIKPKEKELTNTKKLLQIASVWSLCSYRPGHSRWVATPEESEKPPHEVKILQSFYLQTTQITQGQWKKVMGDNPSQFKDCGDDCPVESVSWDDTQKFIQKLNEMEGTDKYRLPTEAEWEYACRAGTTTEFSFGDDAGQLGEYAWFGENSDAKRIRLGPKNQIPGAFTTCTAMSGSGWRTTGTTTTMVPRMMGVPGLMNPRGTIRVMRGGSWYDDARFCRSADRGSRTPDYRNTDLGFRLARSVALGP